MVKVQVNDQEYYMDGYLKSNLDLMKEKIREDFDFVTVIDGRERRGKSKFSAQLAYYCDPTFDLSRVTFTPRQFEQAVKTAEPYTSIIFDEAYFGMASSFSLTWINKKLITMMTKMGQKNLFVWILLPYYFDLCRYLALARSTSLIHVYTDENMNRGFFRFYDYEVKKRMYLEGKKLYDYRVVKPNFYGRFTNYYPLDWEGYKKKKAFDLAQPESLEGDPEFEAYYTRRITKRLKECRDEGSIPTRYLATIEKVCMPTMSMRFTREDRRDKREERGYGSIG